jgi:hypothetical protein
MRRLDWRGLIAAMLAGGLVLTLILGVAGAVFWNRYPIGDKGAEVLIAICVAITASIATYFAAKNNNHHKDDPK